MEFKKGYQDIDTKTGKVIEVPNEYGETTTVTDYASPNKTLIETENGLTNLNEILEEVGETQIKKKKFASGGVAYMLGE